MGDVRLIVGLGISAEALWLAYLHKGGSVSCAQIERFLDGHLDLDTNERAILVEVIRQRLLAQRSEPSPRYAHRHVDLDPTVDLFAVQSSPINSASRVRG
jgi:hypothetical protein